eukprot:CAMPEP_0195292090 /NCGR_PEP_ID=MMETSP0707-20130614/8607_1 /TAXON_ID=33640 /ORGANISM="Asterionellopsis glacialis, Strain CCMP134" /LENGTH=438 /DNA_ID=CAMNT_0040352479 /DNA_START=27 /DNA_END=1343 /DNA_ORIENTATION=-
MKFSTQAFKTLLFLVCISVGTSTSSIRQGRRKVEAEVDPSSLRYLQEQELLANEKEPMSLVESQFGPNPYANNPDPFQLVLNTEFALSDAFVPFLTLDNARADYCNLSFETQKQDPSLAPFYIDLVGQSQHCLEHGYSVPLKRAVEECRVYDSSEGSNTFSLKPKGFIFHQPHAGASLVSNALVAASPSTTRVVSHSRALANVLKACGNNPEQPCDRQKHIQILQDVVYLLGRTNDSHETQMFVTLDATATVHLDLVREAFPDVPWIFVYRNPDAVLQKVLATQDKQMCLKNRRNPTKGLQDFVGKMSNQGEQKNTSTLQELEDEEVCSALLGTYLHKALEEYEKDVPEHYVGGRLVNYDEELLTKEGLFHVLEFLDVHAEDEAQSRIETQRQKKSNDGKSTEWKGDEDANSEMSDTGKQANQKYVQSLHNKATQMQQ